MSYSFKTPKDTLDHYMTGGCAEFAVAVHDLTGLPLVGIARNIIHGNEIKASVPHVAVLISDADEAFMDVRGISKNRGIFYFAGRGIGDSYLLPLSRDKALAMYGPPNEAAVHKAMTTIMLTPSLRFMVAPFIGPKKILTPGPTRHNMCNMTTGFT